MKKTMRKALGIGVCMALCVGLFSGCGSSSSDAGEGSTNGESGSAASESTEKQVTIRLSSCLGEAEPGYAPMNEAVAKFMENNPNIKVELEVQSSTQYHEKLVSEIASDTLPNVFMHWGGAEMREAVDSGKVMDVTERLDSDTELKSQFSDIALNGQNVKYDDLEGTWGVPFSNVSAGFYYNKDLFEKAGISSTPTTWTELEDCIEKLKAIDVVPWALGAKDGWRAEHLYSAIFYRMNGIEGAKKLGDRSMKYADADAIAPWDEIIKLVDMGAFGPDPASVDFNTEMSMFQTGKAAMDFNLSAFVETYTGSESDVADSVGYFDVPTYEGKEQYAKNNFGGGDIALGIATNASDEEIEAAWTLCQYLSGEEGSSIFVDANALLIANDKANANSTSINPLTQDFSNIISSADAVCTDVTQYDSVSTALTKIRDVASAVVNGQMTSEQAGQEMDSEIEMYSE